MQCIKSNRECGGYQRERMWVPNNQVKLEGGTPLGTPSHPSRSRNKSNTPDSDATTVELIWTNTESSVPQNEGALQIVPRLTQMVDSYRPIQQQLLGEFMHSFIPNFDGRKAQKGDMTWLMFVPGLVGTAPALETSLLALSTAQLGRSHDSNDLIIESRRLYCQSLRELGKALKDPELVYRDETLAACVSLSLYEVIECPSENDKGLITHSNGCMRLVEARGPDAHSSELAHQLFLTCRYNSVRS